MHLLVPGHQPISALALVDSGASGTFIDPSVLLQSRLTPLPPPHPIPVELIDGSSASPVTHYFPSRLRIHGTHSEDITFDVIQLAHFQVVLGFPWLARHNPTIDWHAHVRLPALRVHLPC